jgi:hypothetical protein
MDEGRTFEAKRPCGACKGKGQLPVPDLRTLFEPPDTTCKACKRGIQTKSFTVAELRELLAPQT